MPADPPTLTLLLDVTIEPDAPGTAGGSPAVPPPAPGTADGSPASGDGTAAASTAATSSGPAPTADTGDDAHEAHITARDFAERVLRHALAMQRDDLPPAAHTVYLSLVYTSDAAIAALNRDYRGIDAPTDVLSFPQHDHPREATPPPIGGGRRPKGRMAPPFLLGDIVISLPRAAAQARQYGHSPRRELGFLLVHGLLHLLGHDHQTPADAARMEARQEAILAALDLPRDTQP